MYNEIFGADVEQDDLGWTVMADGKPSSVVRAQGSLFNSPANYTDPMGTCGTCLPPAEYIDQLSTERKEEQGTEGQRALIIQIGKDLSQEGAVRDVYNKTIRAIGEEVKRKIAQGMPEEQALEWGRNARDSFMKQLHNESTPLGKALAEKMKAESRTTEELIARKGIKKAIEGVGHPNPKVSKWMMRSRVAGTTLIIASAAMAAREIYNAPPQQKWRILARESGMWPGAIGGGTAGTKGGAALGTLVGGPGLGTGIGGFTGGVIGSLAGGIAGSEAAEQLYEYAVPE